MNRFRLALASVLVKCSRVLLRQSSVLMAGLPQTAPVVPETGTDPAVEALRALVPAPTFDEIASLLHRFTHERAPLFPGEAVALSLYIARFAEVCAPSLARYLAAIAPPPPPLEPPSKDDAVN